MRLLSALCLSITGAMAAADVVVSNRIIRPQTLITADALVLREAEIEGAIGRFEDLVGLEARVALYPGRPIRPGDVGQPALVERNQRVKLIYRRDGLMITADARALDRAAVGEALRVMNLSSRATVTGRVRTDGSVEVR